MIKDIINFVQWQWRKFEFWQKCFICSSFFFGAAVVSEPPYTFYLSIVPMVVVFSYMTKWMIWDAAKASWKKYQEEKKNLFFLSNNIIIK